MKIWIVNHYADPPEGGKYLRHFHFAKELISRGHEVMIFTASTIHNTRMNLAREGKIVEKNYEGVPYVFVPVRNYSSLKSRAVNMLEYTFRLPKAVKAYYKPDVIYASSPHPFCLWIAGRLARRYRARFVAEVRDLWPETFVSMGKFGKKNPAVRALYALEKSSSFTNLPIKSDEEPSRLCASSIVMLSKISLICALSLFDKKAKSSAAF